MSGSENSSESSESSDSSNLSDYNEWEAQVLQQNLRLQLTMCELLINVPDTSRRRYCDREREQGEARLMEDSFVENPTYDQATFWRRFRMRKPLFLRIVATVTANDIYFQQRRDATGRQCLSPLQKCTGAMRVLAYGTPADADDEYLNECYSNKDSSYKVCIRSYFMLQSRVPSISCFSQEYLQMLNDDDLARLLHDGEERGFSGMIGSIDCMHWEWKNCATAWAGQYAGRRGKPTIILEDVMTYGHDTHSSEH